MTLTTVPETSALWATSAGMPQDSQQSRFNANTEWKWAAAHVQSGITYSRVFISFMASMMQMTSPLLTWSPSCKGDKTTQVDVYATQCATLPSNMTHDGAQQSRSRARSPFHNAAERASSSPCKIRAPPELGNGTWCLP